MTIRTVFRVQCDGPCKGWLSVPPHLIGRDILHTALTVEPTAVHAGNWPGERAARTAAVGAGWQRSFLDPAHAKWLCPGCRDNPLGIVLPPDPVCICTHPLSQHNLNGLCVALPGTTGCGCLGWLEKRS
jgi:hypothetical protein